MSYRIYPITASEPAMQGYRVWINGEEAPLHRRRKARHLPPLGGGAEGLSQDRPLRPDG